MSSNFLQRFRNKDTRAFQNFDADQFLEVWQHYDADNSGFIEDSELDAFLREFVASIVRPGAGAEVVSEAALKDVKEELLLAYDTNEDKRIEIGELAQMLPTEQTFLLLFRRENPVESSVEFMRVWRSFDQDGSGHIDKDELKDFLRHIVSDRNVTEARLQHYADTILELFDRNSDGRLQLSELAKLLPVKHNFLVRPLLKNSSRLTAADVERIFRKYDVDRSGKIEGIELKGFLKDLMELTGEDYDDRKMQLFQEVIMQQWDADGDGSIGIEELRMILLQHRKG